MRTSNYIIWEHSELYTSYGVADAWMIKKEYDLMHRFDSTLSFAGMLEGKSYQEKPVDMQWMENPSSKVVKMSFRQNLGQEPRTALYNPMACLCKTTGERVFAKDLKPGDLLVAIGSEVRVEYVELMDYKSSTWYILTTAGLSPNIFINLLLTFPTALDEVANFEVELDSEEAAAIEYKTEDEMPFAEVVGKVDPAVYSKERELAAV